MLLKSVYSKKERENMIRIVYFGVGVSKGR